MATRNLTKPDHLLRAVKYRTEVKCTSASHCPRFGKWGHPGRIWVRGYDKEGNIVYEKTIGYADTRYTGDRSWCGQLLRDARNITRTLARISRHAKHRGGLKLTGLKLDNIHVTQADSEAAWCALDSKNEGISARELLQLNDNQLNRRLIFAAAIRQGVLKDRPRKAA